MERDDSARLVELGGIPPGFEASVLEDMRRIQPNQSVHRAFIAAADLGIRQRVGPDTLVRFVQSNESIRNILAHDVASTVGAHFSVPEPMPDKISREVITMAVYDMVSYFVQHLHDGSFFDYLQTIKRNLMSQPDKLVQYNALLASEQFGKTLVRSFRSFGRIIVDDRLIHRFRDEPETRRSYFGHFVTRLIEERADAEKWIRLFVDATRYGADVGDIYSLAASIQGPAVVRDETRLVLGEQPDPHFADKNFLIACNAQAASVVELDNSRTAQYIGGLKMLRNFPPNVVADICRQMDPFDLIVEYWKMPAADHGFHGGLMGHIGIYFDTTAAGPNGDPRDALSERDLNKMYYWGDTNPSYPRPHHIDMSRYQT